MKNINPSIFDFTALTRGLARMNANRILSVALALAAEAAAAADFTVAFRDADSEAAYYSQSVAGGECACPPADPIRFGHDFAGWTSDGGRTVKSYDEINALAVTNDTEWVATFAAHATRRLRVGVWSGPGANSSLALKYHRLMWNSDRIEYASVAPEEVIAGSAFEPLDMLLIPGGTTAAMYDSMETAGRQNLIDWVHAGGRYFGTCAGTAYCANDKTGTHIGLAPYSLTAQSAHKLVKIALTEAGQAELGSVGWEGPVTNSIWYSSSPIMSASANANGNGLVKGTFGFQVLATYAAGLNSNFLGRYALAAGTNQLGRMFLSAPHPEYSESTYPFITMGIQWLFKDGVVKSGDTAETMLAAASDITFALPADRRLRVAMGPANTVTYVGWDASLPLARAIDRNPSYQLDGVTADDLTGGVLDDYDVFVVLAHQSDDCRPGGTGYTDYGLAEFVANGGTVLYMDDGDVAVLKGLRACLPPEPDPDPQLPFPADHTVICYGDSATWGERAGFDPDVGTPVSSNIQLTAEELARPNYHDGRLAACVELPGMEVKRSYPFYLSGLVATNYNVINQGRSGMCTDFILGVQGVMEAASRYPVTLPKTAGTFVSFTNGLVYTDTNYPYCWQGHQYYRLRDNKSYDKLDYWLGQGSPYYSLWAPQHDDGTLTGTLNGERVRIDSGRNNTMKITRLNDAASDVTIPTGATFVSDATRLFHDAVHIVSSGGNDGVASSNAVLYLHRKFAAGGYPRWLILTPSFVTGKETWAQSEYTATEKIYAAEFGDNALPQRHEIVNRGVEIAHRLGYTNITAVAKPHPDGLFCVEDDGAHFSYIGYRVMAEIVMERLVQLGYVEPSAPVPSEPAPVYDPTADAWTFRQDTTYGYATNAAYAATQATFEENASLVITNGSEVTVSNVYLGASGNVFDLRESSKLCMTTKTAAQVAGKTWTYRLADESEARLKGSWTFKATDVINITATGGGYFEAVDSSTLADGVFHFDLTDSTVKFTGYALATANTSIRLNNGIVKSNWGFTLGTSGAQTIELLGAAPSVRSANGPFEIGAKATVTLRPALDWSATVGIFRSTAPATKTSGTITLASGAKFNVDVSAFAGLTTNVTFCLISAPTTGGTRSINLPEAANVTVSGTDADKATVTFAKSENDRYVYVTVAMGATPTYPSWIDNQDTETQAKYATWSAKYGVTDPSTASQAAYLLNCSNVEEVVEAERKKFQIKGIAVGADGTVTVDPPTGDYNGTVRIGGDSDVTGAYTLPQSDPDARFFKAFLEQIPSN